MPYADKQKEAKRQLDKSRRQKIKAVNHLGGKCKSCGYKKHPAALQFHHRDKSKKSFGISNKISSKWETLRVELKKCDLLCANCHAVVTCEEQKA